MSGATLSVCTRCRPAGWTGPDEDRPGAVLANELEAALEAGKLAHDIEFRRVRCMSQCLRPCVISLGDDTRYTYLFGDLAPDAHAQDVLQTVALWLTTPEGYMTRQERPESMRTGILGRLPPLESSHELVVSRRQFAAGANPSVDRANKSGDVS
ncbi:MAG: DUF1636 domain-containing protein [Alphaproteobacteria bacterium]|nr:DUF1636 domain-containing protein [Alphaproteobacteria bacterium]